MKKTDQLIVTLLSILNCNISLANEETPNFKEETLTSDWGGSRTFLYSKGVELSLVHKSDVLSNVGGGIKQGTRWLGNTEAQLSFDLDKSMGWQGVSALLHFHNHLGSKFNSKYVGGFSGVDNIEVSTNTAQFYQVWMQKNWLDDRFSVLAGLYAVDTEFYVTNSSGIFLQPPLGIGGELAQSGINGPSVFPFGTLGVRVKYISPSTEFYVQGALTDGVPGDPDNPRGTHIKLGRGDGTFRMLEVGYTPEYHDASKKEQVEAPANYMNKTAFGIWQFTHPLDDLTDVNANGHPINRNVFGAYFLAERPVYLEREDKSQGLTGFFRFGYANKDVHQADWASSLGLHYIGLLDGRNDDIAGVAITVNHASSKYRSTNNAETNELNLELTYKAQIKPWLFIQPDLQYIVNPGMDKSYKNATVIGFRTELAL